MTEPGGRLRELSERIEGTKRRRHTIVCPEGVPLEVHIAGNGERLVAFVLDMFFMSMAIAALYFLLLLTLFAHESISVAMTLILFLAFLVRNLYFLHFELAWGGRTPGKKICGLRVVSRAGGELAPGAVIARNLTREVEIFLPLSLYFNLSDGPGGWSRLALFAWVFVIASLPIWNREHLRAGDLIGGTLVISMPVRVLLADLSDAGEGAEPRAFSFSHEQLAIYGAFELQVLEEFLRRPPSPEADYLLAEVCGKICRKIGWREEVPPNEVRRFLNDFYVAERAELERGQLFGRIKTDQNEGVSRE